MSVKQVSEEIIGMQIEQARKFAREHKVVVRMVKEDGKSFGVTLDYCSERINVGVEKGVVTKIYSFA